MQLTNGQIVYHWNYGQGVVQNAKPDIDDVPDWWQHDHTAVALVAFEYYGNEWVQIVDLDDD